METINENINVTVCASFTDEDEVAMVPFSATYTLYDKFTGTVRTTGTLSPLSSTIDIAIPYTANGILDENNLYEIAVLFLEFTYNGGTKKGNGEYSYKIRNLAKA